MIETIEVNDRTYEVIGHAPDGLPIIRGVATSTEDGVDEDGNPKRSVEVTVPSVNVGVEPGEAK